MNLAARGGMNGKPTRPERTIHFLPIGVTPCIRSPLWVGEAAVSDVKGFGENEGAQRPGIESRKNKRRFRVDSGVEACHHPDKGGVAAKAVT